jgi:hypothetical protein
MMITNGGLWMKSGFSSAGSRLGHSSDLEIAGDGYPTSDRSPWSVSEMAKFRSKGAPCQSLVKVP